MRFRFLLMQAWRLHSSSGVMRAEKLHGDVSLEGAAATVEVRDITNAHVHVKTLNGSVKLTNIQDGHVEVDSLQRKRDADSFGYRSAGAGHLHQR